MVERRWSRRASLSSGGGGVRRPFRRYAETTRNSVQPASTATAQPSIIDVSRGGESLWDIRLWTKTAVPPEGDSEAVGDDPDDNRRRQEGKTSGNEPDESRKEV